MRISDWSSDVCSSDLNGEGAAAYAGAARQTAYIEAATISAINECFPPVASDRLYLDHAATTPILPQAKAAMAEALESWSNPSSPHGDGRAARAEIGRASCRERVCQYV